MLSNINKPLKRKMPGFYGIKKSTKLANKAKIIVHNKPNLDKPFEFFVHNYDFIIILS